MVEYSTAALDRVFSAVSDATRRAILETLAKKPATITEIATPFSVSLNAVSKHIMVLERAGLIRREDHGHVGVQERRQRVVRREGEEQMLPHLRPEEREAPTSLRGFLLMRRLLRLLEIG